MTWAFLKSWKCSKTRSESVKAKHVYGPCDYHIFGRSRWVAAGKPLKFPLFKDNCEKPQNVNIMEKPGSWPRDHENPWSKNLRSRIPWDHDHEIIQFLGSKPWDHGFMIHWSSNFKFEDNRIKKIMI